MAPTPLLHLVKRRGKPCKPKNTSSRPCWCCKGGLLHFTKIDSIMRKEHYVEIFKQYLNLSVRMSNSGRKRSE